MTHDGPVALPATLRVALGVSSLETLWLVAVVVSRSDQVAGAKAILVAGLAVKLFFLWRLARLSPAAVFAVLMFELSALLVAAVGPDLATAARLGLAAAAGGSIVLITASMHAFPSPDPPRPFSSTIE